jgi:UDP-2,3-diacylglucosamine hydrolase
MSLGIVLKSDAIFIADSHYPHYGDDLVSILRAIIEDRFHTPQLFLMGDIFDLLFGYNEYIKSFSQNAINIINELSKKIEIYYIEGNHDFCLKDIFPHVKVFSRIEQPIKAIIEDKEFFLSHGDKYETTLSYNIYSYLMRNRVALTLLKPFEKSIIDKELKKLNQKNICTDFKMVGEHIAKIIKFYPKNSHIIEGHFHVGKKCDNYTSLPSLVCQKQVGILKDKEIEFLDISKILD